MSIDTRTPVAEAPRQAGKPGAGRPTGPGGLHTAGQGLLVVWALLCVVPLLWAVLTSFKSDREIFLNPWGLPSEWHFENFVRAWTSANIGRYFINSAIVVCSAVVLVMLLGAMVSYVLARYEFRGRNLIYYTLIAGMTFPLFLALVPLFFVVQNLGLLDTYHGLVLVYTAYALPFTVFFLTSFFRTLPGELVEAAMLDGCSHAGAFFRIMLPLARPGIISVGILNFFGLWNQFLLPLVLMRDQERYVLSQGLAVLTANQGYRSDWSALFAGLVIAVLPVLAVYVTFQRRIQEGLGTGALK
ncbi:carbohydrate ABC transporter permease [Pseudonocardia zijingensis]|jgi:N-acetylglucosamine transport system permease protein|uniref:Carbohydrate ABC transporter permease n=1 Tax=Pseudonocardia zijingensis TaxID=153376 RepID=A0ABN1QLE7_9PSEU